MIDTETIFSFVSPYDKQRGTVTITMSHGTEPQRQTVLEHLNSQPTAQRLFERVAPPVATALAMTFMFFAIISLTMGISTVTSFLRVFLIVMVVSMGVVAIVLTSPSPHPIPGNKDEVFSYVISTEDSPAWARSMAQHHIEVPRYQALFDVECAMNKDRHYIESTVALAHAIQKKTKNYEALHPELESLVDQILEKNVL